MTTTIAANLPADEPLTAPDEPLEGPVGAEPATVGMTDRELLARFAARRDESAFSQLVARHGALVLAVCRRVLRQAHDVDDAFQATFMALARRAGQIAWQESAAAWLHKVAFRAACRLRSDNARKREVEWSEQSMVAADLPDRETDHQPEWDDIAAASAEQALHEEVLRLPNVYRDAIVLCYLEGMSRADAARELGTSETVVKGRLQRARKLLVMQLGLRGLALSAVLSVFQVSISQAAPAVPPALIASTAAAAGQFVAGDLALLSSRSVSLARGVPQMISQATLASKAAWPLGLLCAVGLAGALAVGSARAGDGYGARAAGPAAPVQLLTQGAHAAGDGVLFQLAAGDVDSVDAKTPETKKNAKPAESTAGDQAAAERVLLDKLKLPARMEFIETPLADVVEFLMDEFEMPIIIDKAVLEAAAIDTNTPITANLQGVSLRAALRRTLSAVSLCYVLRDEMVVITTPQDAAADFSPRIYPVADLLNEVDDDDIQRLAELIKDATGPNTWRDGANLPGQPPMANGAAKGTITPHGRDLLVILQAWPVHEQIENFLTDLRKHKRKIPAG